MSTMLGRYIVMGTDGDGHPRAWAEAAAYGVFRLDTPELELVQDGFDTYTDALAYTQARARQEA